MPSYTLAPEARISQMTSEIAAAIAAASELSPGTVVVSGHSAGGHLAARMACDDLRLDVDLRLVVPVSPLADLAPIALTSMNLKLNLDTAEAFAESPIHHKKNPAIGCHVWVGAQERPVFLWQARLLSETWGCAWTAAESRHHFDVIEDFAHGQSALVRRCLDGV